MRRYVARRLLLMVPTFFGITVVTFAVMHLAPGDPAQLSVGDAVLRADVSREAIAHFRQSMGLDEPLAVQYWRWLARVARLDFGTSWRSGRAVSALLAERLPVTLLLSSLALVLSTAIAIPLGVQAAVRRGTLVERATTLTLFALYSLPVPLAALAMVLYLGGGRYLALLPIQGLHSEGAHGFADFAWHLVAPVLCLTYGSLAASSRFMRAAMLEELGQDYVRAARAKGLAERAVIWRHAARNSLVPMVTLLGLAVPHLLGGSVVVERIFGIDGMGMLAFRAILERDYDVVMGIATVTALVTMLSLLASDLVVALVDPRIRL